MEVRHSSAWNVQKKKHDFLSNRICLYFQLKLCLFCRLKGLWKCNQDERGFQSKNQNTQRPGDSQAAVKYRELPQLKQNVNKTWLLDSYSSVHVWSDQHQKLHHQLFFFFIYSMQKTVGFLSFFLQLSECCQTYSMHNNVYKSSLLFAFTTAGKHLKRVLWGIWQISLSFTCSMVMTLHSTHTHTH